MTDINIEIDTVTVQQKQSSQEVASSSSACLNDDDDDQISTITTTAITEAQHAAETESNKSFTLNNMRHAFQKKPFVIGVAGGTASGKVNYKLAPGEYLCLFVL